MEAKWDLDKHLQKQNDQPMQSSENSIYTYLGIDSRVLLYVDYLY